MAIAGYTEVFFKYNVLFLESFTCSLPSFIMSSFIFLTLIHSLNHPKKFPVGKVNWKHVVTHIKYRLKTQQLRERRDG